METNDLKNLASQMDKQGLRVYAILAAFVYVLALVYCFSTDHNFEGILVGIVMLALAGLVAWIYKS